MTRPRAIQSLEAYRESLNILIYGDSGCGKTPLLGTAQKALFLGIEKGTISAALAGSKADIWPIDDNDELKKAYDWLEQNPEEYRWILVDSLTHLQDVLWRESIARGQGINPDRDPDVLAQQDYLRVQNQLKDWVRRFNDLPQNVVYSAQAMRTEDDEDDVLMLPLISGKKGEIAQKICGMMDVVAYLQVVTPKGGQPFRRLICRREGQYFAKCRFDTPTRVAVGKLDNPTIPALQAKIEASFPKKPAAAPAVARRRRRTA